jgi:excinuclease ABC subunit A
VLHKLRDDGNTIVVIEHNLDVIKTADQVVDLGPDGGHRGGTIIATGTPEEIAANPASHTGRFLAKLLPTTAKATKPAAMAKAEVLPPRMAAKVAAKQAAVKKKIKKKVSS